MKKPVDINSLIEDLDKEEEAHIETWHAIRLNSGSPENDGKISQMKERLVDFGRKTSELSDSLSLGRREQTCPASIGSGIFLESTIVTDEDHKESEIYEENEGHKESEIYEENEGHKESEESDTSGILSSKSSDSFSNSVFPTASPDLRLPNIEALSSQTLEEINEGKGCGSDSRESTSRVTEVCEEEIRQIEKKIEEIESFIATKKTKGLTDTVLLDKLCKALKDVEELGVNLEEERNKKNEYIHELSVLKQSEENAYKNKSQQLLSLKEAEEELERLTMDIKTTNNEIIELQSKTDKAKETLLNLQKQSEGLTERRIQEIELCITKKGEYQSLRCQLDKIKIEKEEICLQVQLKENEVKVLTEDVWKEKKAKLEEEIDYSKTQLIELEQKLDLLKSAEREELQIIEYEEEKSKNSIKKNRESIQEKMKEIKSLESVKKARRERLSERIKADEESHQKEMKNLINQIKLLEQEILIEENNYTKYEALNLPQAFRSLQDFDLTDITSLDLSYLGLSKDEKSTITVMKKKLSNKTEEDLALMQWCVEQQGYQIESLSDQLKYFYKSLEKDGISILKNSSKLKTFVEGIPKVVWPANWESKLVAEFQRKASVSQNKTRKAHELIGKLLKLIESLSAQKPKEAYKIENVDPFTSPSDFSPNFDNISNSIEVPSNYASGSDSPFKSPSDYIPVLDHISGHNFEEPVVLSKPPNSYIQKTVSKKGAGKEEEAWDHLDD